MMLSLFEHVAAFVGGNAVRQPDNRTECRLQRGLYEKIETADRRIEK